MVAGARALSRDVAVAEVAAAREAFSSAAVALWARQCMPREAGRLDSEIVAWAEVWEPPADATCEWPMLWALAAVWGVRVGLGRLAVDDAYALLRVACERDAQDGGHSDWRWWFAKLVPVVDYWAEEAEIVAELWEAAARRVMFAVRPLFRARASADDIEAAARRAAGTVLPWRHVVPVLRAERLSAAGRRV